VRSIFVSGKQTLTNSFSAVWTSASPHSNSKGPFDGSCAGKQRESATKTPLKILQKTGENGGSRTYVQDVQTPSNTGEQSYQQKELQDMLQRIRDFHSRFGWAPATVIFGDRPGQAASPVKRPEKSPNDLLSVPEVAAQIGVTEDTIRKWARSGKITSVRLSKVDLRFRQADINEFIFSRLNKRKSAYK
jgi:excisionase family DNA binding protein